LSSEVANMYLKAKKTYVVTVSKTAIY